MEILSKRKRASKISPPNPVPEAKLSNDSVLVESLEQNLANFKQFTGISHDINSRLLKLSIGSGIKCAVIFLEGITDKDAINNSVIKPLIQYKKSSSQAVENTPPNLEAYIREEIITSPKVESSDRWTAILDNVYSGDTILLVDTLKNAIIIGTRKWIDRGVTEGTTEQVIRGPKDSFSETITTTVMLIRRRIKSPKLQFEYLKVGSLSKTDLFIVYINGIVNNKIVDEVRKRISRIETGSINSTAQIEEFIEDSPFSVFPQIIHTERPDKAASHLLEGGVCVLIDGTPLVLLMPVTFWQFLYSPDDYYDRLYTTFIVRFLRLISLTIALVLPSFYIAICSFHQEMIPIGLLDIIVAGRKDVPFPIFLEVFIMEFILEVIREAGVRLPQNVGQAISIVGALVLGQAAIQAKLASPATVTIVSITAIANFTIPAFSAALSVRFLRFGLIILSAVWGIMGFITGVYILLVHLCSLRSFGVPFMAPFAPMVPSEFKDSLIRLPVWLLSKRSRLFGSRDPVRQKDNLKPGPDNNE